VFEDEAAADIWADEAADGAAVGASVPCSALPAPRPHSFEQGSLLRTLSPEGEAIYDLDEGSSASSFFVAAATSSCASGVWVQGVALTSATGLERTPVTSKRRRIGAAAYGTPAGSSASATMNLQATATNISRVVGDAVRPVFPVSGHAGPVGKRSPPRPLVSWSYFAPRDLEKGGKAGKRSSLEVANPPTDWVAPDGVAGETLRTYALLMGGTSVFLTGPPGCGKTYMANKVIDALRESGQSVAACGSTGVASALVNGITVHSWAGFCNGDADVTSPLDVLLQKVIPLAAKVRMCSTTVLVVDEVGTLSAAFLTRLDLVLRAVRRRGSPLGGMNVLFLGDFLQLVPPKGQYAILSDVWRAVFANRAVVLETHWRHVRDSQLLGLLLRVRAGTHTCEDMTVLETRRSLSPPRHATWLFCHILDALTKNEDELKRLPGTPVEFRAVDKALVPYLTRYKASALLDTTFKYVRVLDSRVGAMVAVPTGCLSKQGVPSGSRGVVLSFVAVGALAFPRVRFSLVCGGHKTVVVLPTTAHAVALDGWSKAATRTQVPLVLAWAATIHAAQGWTLPEVAVDLSKAFAAGQALSGLSRTPTLEGLHLVGFEESKILVDSAALAFHEGLHAWE